MKTSVKEPRLEVAEIKVFHLIQMSGNWLEITPAEVSQVIARGHTPIGIATNAACPHCQRLGKVLILQNGQDGKYLYFCLVCGQEIKF